MVTRRRCKKRRTFPLYLIAQESRKAQNQIQPRSRERSDKRQRRLGTRMYDNSAQPKNLESSSHWKNSSLENSFKITQPRPFTQSLVVKFRTKRKMLTMVVQVRLCHLWRNSNLESMKLNPRNPPLHQKKCSPKLLKSQRCALLLPTCFNKPKNVMRVLQT